jgi:hypothetical protein
MCILIGSAQVPRRLVFNLHYTEEQQGAYFQFSSRLAHVRRSLLLGISWLGRLEG